MRTRRNVIYLFIVLMTCIGTITLSGIGKPLSAQNSIPNAIKRCVPAQQVARADVISTTQKGGTTYYLLAAYEQGENTPSDLLISASNQTCKELLYNPMGDRIALASVVNRDIARQLTLGRYRRELNRIGKAALQQQINQSAAGGNVTWFDEQIWALRQLGITIPRNVKVQ